jgi:predicted kinase
MKNITLKILVGASGSGKSFAANRLLSKEKSWKCLERDKIRSMLAAGNNIWRQGDKIESLVTKTQEFLAEQLINEGFNVLISDTCLNPKTQEFWRQFATRMHVNFEIDSSFLSVPLDVLILRDQQRENSVGAEVIIKQYKKYVEPLGIQERPYTDFLPKKYVQDYSLPISVVSDLDGSLCLLNKFDKSASNYRNPYDSGNCMTDELNVPLKKVLDLYRQAGYSILLVSGREDKFEDVTCKWLEKHDVKFDGLYMRKSGDNRKDYVIKDEIYENIILKKYWVETIFDDRQSVCDHNRMRGANVWQVNAGNF